MCAYQSLSSLASLLHLSIINLSHNSISYLRLPALFSKSQRSTWAINVITDLELSFVCWGVQQCALLIDVSVTPPPPLPAAF